MNVWTYVYIFATISYLYAAVYVVKKYPYSVASLMLACVFGSIAVSTSVHSLIFNNLVSVETVSEAIKYQGIGWVLMVLFLVLFIAFFTKDHRLIRSPFTYFAGFGLAIFFIFSNFNNRMVVYNGQSYFGYYGKWENTPESLMYIVCYFAAYIYMMQRLVVYGKGHAKKSEYREISRLMIASFTFCFVSGTIANVVLKQAGAPVPVRMELLLLVFVYSMAYASVRYGILEMAPESAVDSLLDSVDDGVIILSAEGVICDANSGAVRIFGRLKDALGMRLAEIVMLGPVEKTMKYKVVSPAEDMTVTTENGTMVSVEVSCYPAVKSGVVAGYICVLADVSKRKRIEKVLLALVDMLKKNNADLENFAHVVAHDLREPSRLASIYLQFFSSKTGDRLSSEEKEDLKTAIENSIRINSIIGSIFGYSGAVKEREHVPVRLAGVLREAARIVAQKAGDAGVELEINDIKKTVPGDLTMLRQLFVNLFDNAIKYRSKEKPFISVTEVETGGQVIISVEDNGVGIPVDRREKVFEMFVRLNPGSDQQGEGVGLALCRKIVRANNGSIWIETPASGRGSVFKVSLPADIAGGTA